MSCRLAETSVSAITVSHVLTYRRPSACMGTCSVSVRYDNGNNVLFFKLRYPNDRNFAYITVISELGT